MRSATGVALATSTDGNARAGLVGVRARWASYNEDAGGPAKGSALSGESESVSTNTMQCEKNMDYNLNMPSRHAATPDQHVHRTTLRHVRQWAEAGVKLPMLTCYDATSAGLLYEAGVRLMLVGDTAAQFILGHDATLHAPLDFMLQITAAVRRGAPNALVMGDMPFGSYQCGEDLAMTNATRFLQQGLADCVKLEVDQSFAPLLDRMSRAGVPVVAHIGSRPQHVKAKGGYRSAGKTDAEADAIVADAQACLDAGVAALLIEAVPGEVAERVVALAEAQDTVVPVIGCGAGPACHGHVIVLHDLLGMTSWQPPFAPPQAEVGQTVTAAAAGWVHAVQSGEYLKSGSPYAKV